MPTSTRPSRRVATRAVAAPPEGAIDALGSASELKRAVSSAPVVVLKLHARGCRACIGVAPRFKKLARLFAGRARFVEMECKEKHAALCAELGVNSLPFFAVWKAGRLMSAEPISFNRIGRLSERINDAVE